MMMKVWQDHFPRLKISQCSQIDMEKTFEEIKSTVLAFCDETCPKTAKNPIAVNGMGLEWIDYGDVMSGGLRLYGVADWMYIDSEMSDRTALHAYRLLGLDKRDALEAERGKAAKLVEMLEAIKYEDEVNGKGWENNHNSTYSRLCRVLEAYKGSNESA
jgi:hypothetical protein